MGSGPALGTLASMTAFARASASLAQGTLLWELKSVNSKGLDLRLRLPPGFDAQEAAFRARIGSVVTRGTVQATLTLQRPARTPEVRIDTALLSRLTEALASSAPWNGRIGPATLDGLLAVRGVVEVVEAAEDPDDAAALATAAVELLGRALDDVAAVRQREGMALGAILRDHLAHIGAHVAEAEAAPGRRPEAVLARLARSVEALLGSTTGLDRERLHQEAVLLAARADVREELDRLAIHRDAATALLHRGGPVGRRLDFLAQELSREANTLCAKSNDAGLTAIGLDLRTRIEQFREQVQNLE